MVGISLAILLMWITLPQFHRKTEAEKTIRATKDLQILQLAVDMYCLKNNKTFPAAGKRWESSLVYTTPVLSVLYDPFSSPDAQYRYATSPNGLYCVIWSVGPDHTAGITGVNDLGKLNGSAGDDIYLISKKTAPADS